MRTVRPVGEVPAVRGSRRVASRRRCSRSCLRGARRRSTVAPAVCRRTPARLLGSASLGV